jgi:hypothetical protein
VGGVIGLITGGVGPLAGGALRRRCELPPEIATTFRPLAGRLAGALSIDRGFPPRSRDTSATRRAGRRPGNSAGES